MPKYTRVIDSKQIVDPHTAQALGFNQPSGALKVTNIGSVLLPIPNANTFTTSAVVAVGLPSIGRSIAVYNNSGTVGCITLGKDMTVASLAPGAVNSNGQAGIACTPNSWTYISCGLQQFVIASASTLLVYLVEDGTFLIPESN